MDNIELKETGSKPFVEGVRTTEIGKEDNENNLDAVSNVEEIQKNIQDDEREFIQLKAYGIDKSDSIYKEKLPPKTKTSNPERCSIPVDLPKSSHSSRSTLNEDHDESFSSLSNESAYFFPLHTSPSNFNWNGVMREVTAVRRRRFLPNRNSCLNKFWSFITFMSFILFTTFVVSGYIFLAYLRLK